MSQLKNHLHELRIHSVDELYSKVINDIQWHRFGRSHMENYRGHAKRGYQLLPGISRGIKDVAVLKYKEKNIFDEFERAVSETTIDIIRKPFTEKNNHEINKNLWYMMFQGQHIGLLTRLMDWSIRWETSLLFAVENEKHHGEDGSLWIFLCEREYLYNSSNIEDITSKNFLDFNGDAMINSPLYLFDDIFDRIGERRIGRQQGRFWIQSHEKSIIPLAEQMEINPMLIEIIIDGNSKKLIKEQLNSRGASLDWHYYRRDESVSEIIRKINK